MSVLMLAVMGVMAQTAVFDFQNNTMNLTVGEGASFADGALSAPVTLEGITLTSVQGEAVYPAIMMKDNNGVISLNVYKNGAIKFSAPEGKALVKVAATMKSKTFALTPSSGSIADDVWTGNATEVTFAAASLYSFLKLEATIADENGETVKPVVVSYDVEVADIAAFNAAEDGKTVKLALNNARVNAYWDMQGAYYVEDATGATVVKGIELKAGQQLNGYLIGVKSTNNQIDYMNDPAVAVEYALTAATDASDFEATDTQLKGTEMTIAAACSQAAYGRLVTLKNVTITGGGQNKTLTDGENNTMKARDYLGVLPDGFTWPEQAASITGVVIYYMTGWFILPISAESIVEAGATPAVATFDFTQESFRGYMGTTLTDVQSYIINETYTVEGVTLQLVGGSAPSRIYADKNRGNCLTMYKEYATMTFRAPEGKTITKIEFTAAGSSTIDFTASSGSIDGMTWTGNADGVRFLNNATPYLANAIVTLEDKNGETVALQAIEYVECANIAAFNALENGTYAKVLLNNVEVIGISADGSSTAWAQDATGGCWIQYTSLIAGMKEMTKGNGFVYAVKRMASANPQMKETEDTPKSEVSGEKIDAYTTIEGTLAEVNKAENLNRVVKITGASFVATNATTGTLTQGDATITVTNGAANANQQLHKITDTWVKDETTMENVTIVAILTAKSATENQLLPISMVEEQTNGLTTITQHPSPNTSKIYNLQGVRLHQLQRGLNIVDGKKIVR